MRNFEKVDCPMATPEPIAIVGIGCRWPGGVNNPSQLWSLLKEKRDGWVEFAPDRININGFYHPNQQRLGSMSHKGGHLLKDDPRQFDHTFFGLTTAEVMSMDPSQRKLLEVTYDAFDNAGQTLEQVSGSRTGVYVGNFNNDHFSMQVQDLDHTLPYVATGGGPTILSNRINYVFNLQGPSSVIDTGCSASMYALHAAVLSLRSGDCDAAIVAGSNIILGPVGQIIGSKMGALSPTSRSHTFDAAADGYSRAEGFGALYVKRLSDALKNNDPIRALVRGTAINANGKTGGISHPSPEGQEAVIRQAYKNAGDLDPNLTGYFECHGTGTPVGDPIEVSAVGKVFASGRSNEPLLIGSIKPNLGHSEAASAMSQIMKALLAMENGAIPATINIDKLNPSIDFDGAKVKVVTELTPWPANKLRRTSINSFGYGGANAHCILDHPSTVPDSYNLNGRESSKESPGPAITDHNEITTHDDTITSKLARHHHDVEDHNSITNGSKLSNGVANAQKAGQPNGHVNGLAGGENDNLAWNRPFELVHSGEAGVRPYVLLPISAHNDQALKSNISALGESLDNLHLANALYTLGARKSVFSRRAFVVAEAETIKSRLDADFMSFGRTPNLPTQRIAFVFTGQGAQWPEMGSKLFHEYAVFRQSIRYMDNVLQMLENTPTWTLEQVLLEPAASSRVHRPEVSQALCTALQIALVNLLSCWGIKPVATVGHSSGEIAAAYAAGNLKAGEAIIIAYCRGQTVAKNQYQGQMIAVGLSAEDVAPYLDGFKNKVTIAAINSPTSITVSGDPDAIQALAQTFDGEGIFNRILNTGNNAYHSHHMLALGDSYEQLTTQSLEKARTIISKEVSSHSVRMVSSVEPDNKSPCMSPRYWRRNLESPVLFSQAVEALAREVPINLMIEIGPHPALNGPLKQIRLGMEQKEIQLPPCLASLRRGEHDVITMLNLAGNLFLHNAPVNLVAVNATEKVQQRSIRLQHGLHCIDMPQYRFAYPEKPIYYESRLNREYRQRKYPRHDLLGARVPGTSKLTPSWRNVIRIKDLPWLGDHKLSGHAVLPAAAYIAMAIEAASQFYEEEVESLPSLSFKLRHVSIYAALPLADDELGIETVLSMEKVVLTNTNATSAWYKFSITSTVPNSDVWIEHCAGTISAQSEVTAIDSHQRLRDDSRFRGLSMKRWYERFETIGLEYGSHFQGLSNLRAYHRVNIAAANVDLCPTQGSVKGDESRYLIHPAALDTCLQIALIAAHAGQAEYAQNAFIPVAIEEMSVWVPQSSEETALGVATGNMTGQRSLYARTQLYCPSGAPLLDIQELKCTLYDGAAPDRLSFIREPYWRTVVRVDVDSLTNDHAQVLSPPLTVPQSKLDSIDNLVAGALSKTKSVNGFDNQAENHDAFLTWVQSITYSEAIAPATAEQLQDTPEIKCINLLSGSLKSILNGERTSLEVLMQDQALHELETSGCLVEGGLRQLRFLVDLLAHKNPRMNILELDAGLGGATKSVLDALQSNSAFKRFNRFTITDSRQIFVADAELRFEGHHGLSFARLNIQDDFQTQGLEAHSFDLIIAASTIGQGDYTKDTLRKIHSLLKPNGRLAILRTIRPRLCSEFFTRIITGKWSEPCLFLPETGWSERLQKCGFSGIDVSLDDYDGSQSMSKIMLSTALHLDKQISVFPKQDDCTYLLHGDCPPPLLNELQLALNGKGINTHAVNIFKNPLPVGFSAISLVDVGSVALLQCDETRFAMIQAAISQASTLLWVSGSATYDSQGEASVMKGLLRVIANERVRAKVSFIELVGHTRVPTSRDVDLITAKYLQMESCAPNTNFDSDFVLRHGMLWIERLLPDEVSNHQFRLLYGLEDELHQSPVGTLGPIRAAYSQPGLISSLHFRPDPDFDKPLKAGWVEIKTEAIGLNVKDIAVATGKYDHPNMSCEAAGIVTRVGSNVSSLRIGDGVFGLIWGNMGNYMRAPASMLLKIPKGVSFTQAASMTVAYTTAIYAFRHIARLERGESVLIQYATGGLGMAAIQLAQSIGAEIYATVGSVEKREILAKHFGIPQSRVFDSRSQKSVDKIMQATGMRGIDVVLCSASGEMMDETLRCIAPFGRFVDVGRVNVVGNGKLSLDVFKRNATFSSFDIGLLYNQKPNLYRSLLNELQDLWVKGIILPPSKITTYDIADLESAMTYFSKGLHAGKVVITMQKPQQLIKVKHVARKASFDPAAAYILVGALGGLGRSLAIWMAERGANHLIFISRSGTDKPEARLLVQELESMGAKPEVVRCSILDSEGLAHEIGRVSDSYTVKGVIHAAMIEGDITFDKANFDQFQSVLGPKVFGTVNLHHATKNLPLDFFLMTSSLTALVGPATQAAYVGGNAFQDAFARFRLSQNLPATSLQIGLILEVGATVNSVGLQQSFQRSVTYGMSETEFLQLVEGALCHTGDFASTNSYLSKLDPGSLAQLATGFEPSRYVSSCREGRLTDLVWCDNPRFASIVQAIIDRAQSENTGGSSIVGADSSIAKKLELASSLAEKEEVARLAFIDRLAELFTISAGDIDPERPMAHYGLDSMVTTELRTWLIKTFGVDVNPLHLLSKTTRIADLVKTLVSSS